MLNEYRYRDKNGKLIYFMDDRERAIELYKKGIEVEYKIMDPFTSQPFHLFDPNSGYRRNNHREGTTKYDYEDFLRLQKMKEKGLSWYQISEITGISPNTVADILEGRRSGYRLFIERYKLERSLCC